MSDFFEKLKKGMDSEELSEDILEEPNQPTSEEDLIEEPEEATPVSTEEVSEVKAEFATTPVIDDDPPEVDSPKPKKKKPSKKKTTKKKPTKKKEDSPEKIEIEETPDEDVEEAPKKDFFDGPMGELTVDVYQSGKDLIVQSAIGGVESEDLDIIIENDLVVIKGSREESIKEEKKDYFFQECHWGSFKREIVLPLEVDSSRAKAKLEKGILIIRMPIIEKKSKTKVSVE